MSKLNIGFARTFLNPPDGLFISGYYNERRGQGMLDDLAASVLAFSDGERTAVVFTIDVIGIAEDFGDVLRKTVAERTGLPYEAVYYACTHTHTAPAISSDLFPIDPEFNSILFRQCADAAVRAMADMSPAEVFTARGKAEDIAFIRRFKMKNGRTQTNPGHANPDIDHPISTPDESLGLVRIVREGKEDLVIINFQVHPDVVSGSYYSSDWPGWVRRSFEGAVSGTKCLFFNGAQGDTNHFNPQSGREARSGANHARHMGLCIAGEAMKLYTYAEKVEGDRVDFCQVNLKVPANRGTAEELVIAEKYIELHENGRESEIPYHGMEYVTVVAKAYRVKRLENGPDSFTLYLNAVRFGDVVFSGVPGEPFTDIGRGIKDGSPFGMTIVCCCANGYEGYYPMQSAYDEGGYEANSSEFTAGVAEKIIDASVEMLKDLY